VIPLHQEACSSSCIKAEYWHFHPRKSDECDNARCCKYSLHHHHHNFNPPKLFELFRLDSHQSGTIDFFLEAKPQAVPESAVQLQLE
jgi:hypothetical protein